MTTPEKKKRTLTAGVVADRIARIRLGADAAAAKAAQKARHQAENQVAELLAGLATDAERSRAVAMANAAVDAEMVTAPVTDLAGPDGQTYVIEPQQDTHGAGNAALRRAIGIGGDEQPETADALTETDLRQLDESLNAQAAQLSPRLLEEVPAVEGVEVNRETGKARRVGAQR